MTTIIFSTFSYLLLLLTIAKVPDQIWDQILNFFSETLTNYADNKKKLPVIGEIYRGQELILAIADCEAKLSLGQKILAGFLPRYKFYTDLLEQLFVAHRSLGIGIKKFIPEIRLALIRDLQFERKVFDEIVSAFLQFLVIAATTWSFVFLSKSLVQIPLHKLTAFFMIFLQAFGAVIFFYLVRLLKQRIFAPFSMAIEELYQFSALLEVGLPVNEIVQKSGILQGSLICHKDFSNLASRAKKLVARMKEAGLSPKDEAQEIIREIWHLQEVHFGKFTKMVQVLKFTLLAFFFLPAYFLYLFSIFKFFMEQ